MIAYISAILLFLIFHAAILTPQGQAGINPEDEAGDWIKAMREIHARFSGRKGTFAHFGDSITVSMAFWAPLPYVRKNSSPEMEEAFLAVNEYLQPECWRDWKGPQYGSEGMTTTRWAYENIDQWLNDLNPETALIMFGSNDVHSLDLDEYRANMRAIVQKCLENGTVVILSTMPPRIKFENKADNFAQAVRELAHELRVPLIDYHREILKRRPEDWNGSLEKFAQWNGYNVPTLLARDGVHPSQPEKYRNDYSEEALSHSGFALRNYLAAIHNCNVIAENLGFLHVMRRQNNRRAIRADAFYKVPEISSRLWIKPGRRFIEKNHAWPIDQRDCQQQALPLTA